MVERKTLYTVKAILTGKRADLLAHSAITCLQDFKDKIKTVTLYNGLAFAHHKKIAKELEPEIYFAHPHAPWERGINENTNGLIRQYFPKCTDFNQVSDEELEHVMNRSNNRPRASRNNRSPNELFLGQRVYFLVAK